MGRLTRMKGKKAVDAAKSSQAGQYVSKKKSDLKNATDNYKSDIKKGAIKGAILGGAAGGAKAAAKPLTNSKLGKAIARKNKELTNTQKLALAGGAGIAAGRYSKSDSK